MDDHGPEKVPRKSTNRKLFDHGTRDRSTLFSEGVTWRSHLLLFLVGGGIVLIYQTI